MQRGSSWGAAVAMVVVILAVAATVAWLGPHDLVTGATRGVGTAAGVDPWNEAAAARPDRPMAALRGDAAGFPAIVDVVPPPDGVLPDPADPFEPLGPGGCALPAPGGVVTGDGGQSPRRPAPPSPTPTDQALDAGLRWLSIHQAADGSWSCDKFSDRCRKNICDGAGAMSDYTPGTTALALLAFLSRGHSHRHGKYKAVVKRGLKYLLSIQTPDGCVGPKVANGRYMYSHAIATMALAEAYGMSGLSPALKGPGQKAVNFLVSAQNPYLGWRYGIRPGDNDTSVTAWAVFALKSAKLSELNVPPEAFAGAKNWFDKVSDESFFKTGYLQKGDQGPTSLPALRRPAQSEAMTAAALASRIFMGVNWNDPSIRGAVGVLEGQPPRWDPVRGNDYAYWYFASIAMLQVGGKRWERWDAARDQALLNAQRRGGDEHGSWDPTSAWGSVGGRVYATAMCLLTLNIYYHGYRPIRQGERW